MSVNKKDVPEFIDPQLRAMHVGEGSFTDVYRLMGKDVVIKEYKLKPFDKEDLVGSEKNLVETARILSERQKLSRDFFETAIPGITLPSNFVVGTNDSGKQTIFEVQKALPAHLSLQQFEESEFNLQLLFGKDFDSKVQVLKQEIKIFMALLNTILWRRTGENFRNTIPDLHEDNVIITNDGHIKLFDFNYLLIRSLGEDELRGTVSTLKSLLVFLDNPTK